MQDKEKVISFSSAKTNKIVNGIFLDAKQKMIPEIKKGTMHKIVAIIMHRTAFSNLNSTLSSFKKGGVGTHFIIDKNGEIIQCLNLSFFSYHIGKIKSKAEDYKSWTKEEQKLIEKLNIKDKSKYEISNKKYPERYPINQESIGIEVVASYDPKTKQWDNATKEQRKSIHELIDVLTKTYSLTKKDIYEHDKISTKLKAKVPIFMISLFYLCFGENIDFSKITNLTIQEPKLLDVKDSQKWKVLCKQWTFSQEKLKAFFKISNYEEHNPYEMFYQAPCEIWGSFTYKKKKCVFVVNGGGITEISCNNKEPFWLGCSDQKCKHYVLIPYDGLEE